MSETTTAVEPREEEVELSSAEKMMEAMVPLYNGSKVAAEVTTLGVAAVAVGGGYVALGVGNGVLDVGHEIYEALKHRPKLPPRRHGKKR